MSGSKKRHAPWLTDSPIEQALRIYNLRRARKNWYDIRNQSEKTQIYIYDEIGVWGVDSKSFVDDLNAIDSNSVIELHLNSVGGEVFEGIAIYNALKQHGSRVQVHVDSLAASIASVIAMSGDEILISKHAEMMIHDARGITIGNGDDHRKMAERLDEVSSNIASIYAGRTDHDEEYWRERMKEETWYRGEQAVDAGLADGLLDPDEEKEEVPGPSNNDDMNNSIDELIRAIQEGWK